MQNEHTTNAFEAFWKTAELDEEGKRPETSYLNINPEGTTLREAQDIDEELRMMIRIYTQQMGAVEDLRKSLDRWNKQLSPRSDGQRGSSSMTTDGDPSLISFRDLDFIEELMDQIMKRKGEIEELARAADRSCDEVRLPSLLELTHNLTLWTVTGTFGPQAAAS